LSPDFFPVGFYARVYILQTEFAETEIWHKEQIVYAKCIRAHTSHTWTLLRCSGHHRGKSKSEHKEMLASFNWTSRARLKYFHQSALACPSRNYFRWF